MLTWWVGDLFISRKFTNIFKQRKETESMFLISWLNDEVIWVFNKGSNIHLLLSLLLFFLSLRKANISCQMERNFSFQYNAEKCTFLVKFIFSLSLCLPTRKRIGMHSSVPDISLR